MKITLKHYDAVNYLGIHENNLDIQKIETFLILFYKDAKMIKSLPYTEVYKLFEKVTKQIAEELKFANKKISNKIRVNGREYKLLKIGKQTIGWMLDAMNLNESSNPLDVVKLCYIPVETSHYGETHGDGTIIANYDDFNEHLPLSIYYQCHAFFLKLAKKSLDRSKGEITAIKILKELKKSKVGKKLTEEIFKRG